MITAKRIRDTQRRAPIPVLDLLPFQQVTRDETEARDPCGYFLIEEGAALPHEPTP